MKRATDEHTTRTSFSMLKRVVVSTALIASLASLWSQSTSSTPPPSPFGSNNDENLSLFNTTHTQSFDTPTFSTSISPLFGITATRSVLETNGSSPINVHMRTGVNIPLSKHLKMQIWYQREMGDLELHNNQFKPLDNLNPAQHYLMKFFYQF